MEVVDKLSITQDKSIIIVKVEKSYYLLSVSQNGIGLIKELDGVQEGTFNILDEVQGYKDHDFKEVLTQYFVNRKK